MLSSNHHPFSASYKSHSSQIPSFSKEHYTSPQHLEKLSRSSQSISSLDHHQPITSIIAKKPKSCHHQERNSIHLKHRPSSIFFPELVSAQDRDFNRVKTIIRKAIANRTLVVDLANQSLSTIPSCINELEVLTSTSRLETKPNDPPNPSIPTSRHRTLTRVSSAPSSFHNSYTSNQFTGLNLILSNNHLTNIKPIITNLKSITRLILRSNRIEIIPEEIQELNQLIELNLTNNHLKFLPSNPWYPKPLKTLNLSNQRIVSEPIYDPQTDSLQKSCIRRICVNQNTEEEPVLKSLTIQDLNSVRLPTPLIHQILNPMESFWKCDECKTLKNHQPIECFEWIEITKEIIPIQFKFCHPSCLNHFFT
ncbi:uncharacterized protein MELLADRAFT_116415 [Melampsora larici-populina 98AG31]|uniref:Uncharacterized protein n=1 Tax=Melampsora larici-populina (strain 98AG31 / pathotype 3-4-7) TaxID=747676 RepID=F4RKX2_MELLP|nr:uncharacterized protein MELLADRAFT_116415 [Melampsora larici-populina 98AG31]EGG06800.1 hypothetical protein MELLADRAFT_116415 [Melampsora larici-populina 98AG31]